MAERSKSKRILSCLCSFLFLLPPPPLSPSSVVFSDRCSCRGLSPAILFNHCRLTMFVIFNSVQADCPAISFRHLRLCSWPLSNHHRSDCSSSRCCSDACPSASVSVYVSVAFSVSDSVRPVQPSMVISIPHCWLSFFSISVVLRPPLSDRHCCSAVVH